MKKKYDAKKSWTSSILMKAPSYPSEYVVRIFKGNYPRLHFDKKFFKNKRICDVGCGDGRNLPVLHDCGFQIYGIEISPQIVDKAKINMAKLKIQCNIKVGTNKNISFVDSFFDFLLSWNSCYYVDDTFNFQDVVKEFARVLRTNGFLILSIPKKSCFIFKNSKIVKKGYRVIKDDPFKIRNGQIFRYFEDEYEIKDVFSKYFKNFVFASIHDDCFGYPYHWHVVICQRK